MYRIKKIKKKTMTYEETFSSRSFRKQNHTLLLFIGMWKLLFDGTLFSSRVPTTGQPSKSSPPLFLFVIPMR